MNKQPPRLSIIIPAAGASQRLGQAKQLVKYKNRTLIQRAVKNAEALQPHEIIVVTGADAEAVQAAVQGTSARCVHNPEWSNGMGGSIATGAQAVDGEPEGLMILLCDQWRIQANDLRLLLKSWQADTGRIICAQTEGRCGPPVIFPSSCRSELGHLKGDHGAHSVLKAHPQMLSPVRLENAASDLDTPAQLKQLNEQ